MGYLLHILLALALLATADLELPEDPANAAWAWLLLLPLGPLLGRLARKAALRGAFRRANRIDRVLRASPVLFFAVSLFGLGWHDWVRRLVGADSLLLDWPRASLSLSLAPYLLFQLATIDARARLFDPRRFEVRRVRAFQTRMFLSGLAPFGVYLLVSSVAGLVPGLQVYVEEVALVGAFFSVLLLVGFAAFLPSLLERTWETAPLAEGLPRTVLEAVAERARFRCRRIALWKTGNTVANAAIIGFFPARRLVVFTDLLLAQLPPRELAAVFAHEIGHALRGHVPVFAAWTLSFFMLGDLASAWLAPHGAAIALGAFATSMLVWVLVFGYLSRRFELDADLASYEITGDAHALARALEQVGGVHSRERDSWRHFSTAKRVLFLRALSFEPAVGERLRRSLRHWARVGAVAFSVLALVELVSLVRSVPEDLLVVDLRLGRYAAAEARVEAGGEGVDARLAELSRRASAEAGTGALATLELEELARSSLARGDLEATLDWLLLGALRGRDDLAQLEASLRHHRPHEGAPVDWEAVAKSLEEAGAGWQLEVAPGERP